MYDDPAIQIIEWTKPWDKKQKEAQWIHPSSSLSPSMIWQYCILVVFADVLSFHFSANAAAFNTSRSANLKRSNHCSAQRLITSGVGGEQVHRFRANQSRAGSDSECDTFSSTHLSVWDPSGLQCRGWTAESYWEVSLNASLCPALIGPVCFGIEIVYVSKWVFLYASSAWWWHFKQMVCVLLCIVFCSGGGGMLLCCPRRFGEAGAGGAFSSSAPCRPPEAPQPWLLWDTAGEDH